MVIESEGERERIPSLKIKFIRIRKTRGVSIRCRQQDQNLSTIRQMLAFQNGVLENVSPGILDGRVEAKNFRYKLSQEQSITTKF